MHSNEYGDAAQTQNPVPSRITISNPPSRQKKPAEDHVERRMIPKALMAVFVTMSVLLLAGVVFVAVTLFTQPLATAAVGPVKTVQTQQPAPSETATQKPKPSATTAQKPSVSPEKEFGSLFEKPDNEIELD